MNLDDLVTQTSKKHEAARIVNGMAFLTDLKKTAATYNPEEATPDSYTASPASALNTEVGARQQFTSVSKQKGIAARGVGSRGGAKMVRVKKASLTKEAIIGELLQGLKSDVKGLSASAEGYREGLRQFREGGPAKLDLGTRWERIKARFTGTPTREQAAYAKGPEYYEAFIRGKNVQKGTGAADIIDELNAAVRNPRGELTPLSVTRGALETGLITPESLKNVARRATDYATGASQEAAAAERTKKILQGAGLVGGGALAGGLVAKNMSSKPRNA